MASAAPEIPVLARDQAFENLYRRYVKDVYHYALALLRNPADAEDVTQTTFMNAYRAFKRGDEIRKPQNWLIRIAHNVARTRYARASRRVKEVPLDDHIDQLAVPETERPNIEEVLRALGRLPLNQRAALVMRELDGYTYAEIADTLGVSVSAVETLIFRARRSMRLKASALRVLGTVPVPAGLATLFKGGAVAAGGGALTGLFAKAMVALVVGTAATSISGDDGRLAVAAEKPNAQTPVTARVLAGERTALVSTATAAGVDTVRVPKSVRASAVRDRVTHAQALRRTATKGSTAASSTAATTAPTAPTAPVTEAAADVVQVVEQAATTAPLPPLPISIPAPPPLPPVEVPPPPPLP